MHKYPKGINADEDNGGWKGDDVKYTSLHQWLNRNYPKKGC